MIRIALILAAILATAALNEYPVAAAIADANSGARPLGHAEFCKANPDLCRVTGTTDPFPISSADLRTVDQINAAVNGSITYAPRPDSDPWDIDPAVGDCDDYVATKLSRLVKAGIPRQNLRAAVVITETDEPHLVILLWTQVGQLVLDNRRDAIVLAFDTPYRFVSVEWVWGEGQSYWITPTGLPR